MNEDFPSNAGRRQDAAATWRCRLASPLPLTISTAVTKAAPGTRPDPDTTPQV